ncbi:NAD-dependent epimerase/dehydratase family protein [Nitrosopumilus sp. S6]
MRVLITGHTGFIGTYLTNYLVSKKYDVIGLSPKSNKKLKIKQIKKDIRKVKSTDISGKIDIIIHLAAITDVNYCQKNPFECYSVNSFGTQKILQIAKEKKSKMVFLSSSHVYGKPKNNPISEKFQTNSTTIYSASKISSEIYCKSYSNSFGMDVSIIRPFSVYGPHQPENFLISSILKQLKNSNTVKIGRVTPRRDFVYISDVVKGIEIILKNTKGFNIFNIGFGKSYSVKEVLEILKTVSNRKFKVNSIKKNFRQIEIPEIRSNSKKLQKLGWKPEIPFKKGIRIMLEENF